MNRTHLSGVFRITVQASNNDKTPQIAIAVLIGTDEPSEKIDNRADTQAAIIFWMKPCKDEAAPAFSGNGWRQAVIDCGHNVAKPAMKIIIGNIIIIAWLMFAKTRQTIDRPAKADNSALPNINVFGLILSISFCWASDVNP